MVKLASKVHPQDNTVARMGTADAERGLVELVLLSVRGDVCSVVHLVSESETD